jgi:hypothetical protein
MRRLYALKRFIMMWVFALMMMGAFATAHAATATVPTLVVKMADGLTADQQAAVVARNGGVETAAIPVLRMHVISIPSGDPALVLQNYQSDPQVERAELNKTRKSEGLPSDSHYSVQWALSKIGWESVFGSIVPTGSAKVAILDTGIDASHPDLHANVIDGTSILDNSSGGSDANGHGTSLAGIVAAVTNNGLGVAGLGFSGVQIMPVTVLNGSGIGQDSDIIAGVIWAADHGADVILMGFSNADFSQNLQDALDYAWAKGAVLVAATGNDGVTTPTFPAGARGVVGVSATSEDDTLAFGSNYGQDTFLAAPGTTIYTTAPGETYTYITGTSASSAMVAGAAALLKAVDPALSNGVIVGRLAKSAAAVGTAGDPANQEYFGNGRLDLAAAIASTSTESVQPAGAAPIASGGPYLGPYVAAASTLVSVGVGNQNGALTAGEAGSATYVVTVTRTGSGLLNVTLTLPTALPNGATASFDPPTLSFTGNTPTSATSTLTITTAGTTPAGPASFKVNGTTGDQEVPSGPATLTITEPVYQQATIIFSNLAKTYTGTALTPTVATVPPGLNVDFSGTPMIDAGSYQVTATASGGNYRGTASTSFTIKKAPATIDVKGYNGFYDGTMHGATGTAIGVKGEDLSTLLHLGATFTDAPGGTAEWNFDGNGNYDSASGTAAITINKAPITVALDKMTQSYTGLALKPSATTTPAGLKIDWTGAPQIDAGRYEVTAAINETNYSGSASGTFIIEKAAATVEVKGYNGIYDGTSHGATGTAIGVKGEDLSTLLHLGGTFTDAPGGTAQWTFDGNGNYNSANGTAAITINKAPITVALDKMTQSYTGVALKPSATTTPAGLKIDWTGAPQIDAGKYEVTAAINETNYSGSASGTFIIEKAAATVEVKGYNGIYDATSHGATGTAIGVKGEDLSTLLHLGATFTDAPGGTAHWTFDGNGNYNSANGTAAVTINKAPITVALDKMTQSYTGVALKPSATTTPAGLKIDWTGAPQIDAGSYQVTAAINDTNYSGSASGTFIIDKAAATIDVKGYNGTYDRTPHGASGTATGMKGEDLSALLHFGATFTDAPGGTAEWTFDGNANYLSSKGPATITINKAAATVAMDNLTQNYTGNPLKPTATTTPAGLSIDLSWASQTDAGSYPVTATINDTNYSGSASGTFTINKAAATIDVTGYNGSYDRIAHGASGTAKGVKGENLSSLLNFGATFTDVPGGTAQWSFAGNANYAPASGSANVSISKAAASVTLSGLSQSYDGSPKTVTVTTNPAGLNVDVTYDSSANAPSKSGSYAVVATVNDRNYQGSASGSLTIAPPLPAPASITVPATNSSGTITINWQGSGYSGLSYVLEYKTSSDPTWRQIYSGIYNYTSMSVANGTYSFRVKETLPGYADSPYTVSTTNCNVLLACDPPSYVNAPASSSTGSVSVNWGGGNVSGLTYTLQYSLNGGSWVTAYTGTYNYANLNLANGRYQFRVRSAKAGYVTSGYATSGYCQVTLVCGAPTKVTAPATSTRNVAISWTGGTVSGATYEVQYNNGSGWSATYSTIYSNTIVTVPTSGTYTFQVRATKPGYTNSGWTQSTPCVVSP